MSKRVLEPSDDDSHNSNPNKRPCSDDDLVDLLLEDINYIDQIEAKSEASSVKRNSTPPLFSLPRILKRDLRKKLPIMLNNVMNSHDSILVKSFFSTFCRGDGCQLQQSCTFNSDVVSYEMPSVDHIISYMSCFLESIPDSIFRMSHFQLKRRSDTEGTEIVCYVTCYGTSIYPLTPPDIAKHVLKSFAGEKNENEFLSNYDVLNPASIHTCGLPRLEKPDSKIVYVTLTMTIDEEKRIQRIGQSALVTSAPC
jgi:hypothetical protein